MENSKIQWCHHTFNPWMGCTKVSQGCANCYAENLMDKRWGKVQWGPNGKRVRTSAANWKKPFQWDVAALEAGEPHRVFCASLADVFEDRDELIPWRDDLFSLIVATPFLDWMLLTKRPENIQRLWPEGVGYLANVWLGASVENQEVAKDRIVDLLWSPAPVHFLSIEPLLGPLCLSEIVPWEKGPLVDLIIMGGESGPGARPMDLEWVYDIMGDWPEGKEKPAMFVKQLGAKPMLNGAPYPCKSRKGDDMDEWPDDLKIREMPTPNRKG